MKRSWIALVVVFVLIVAVAAQVAAQDAAPELSGTVRVGSWESGDALTPWNNAIAAYEAANPNVDVQLEAVPQDYGTKLLAQFASGTAPDIFMSGDGDVAKWVSMGAAENLDPYISGSNGLDMETLLPAVAAFGEVNGSTYYMTKDYSPLVLYYNKDQFEAAGVEAPTAAWTWDDLLAAAQKLTVDANGNDATSADFDPNSIQRWGLQMPDSWGDLTWSRGLEPLVFQNGGSFIAPDGSTFSGYMNSAESVEALQWFVDLVKTHHVVPAKADVDAYSGTDLFQSGIVSMLWTGVWPLNGYKTVEGLNFGTSGLPAGSAGNANVLCWSGFALYTGSQNKDAAWDFLKYISAGEGAKEFANYAWTPVKSIIEEQGLDTDEFAAPIVADLANVKPIPDSMSPNWAACGDHFFTQEFATVVAGDVAVQDALDKAVEQGDACLADAMAAAAAGS